MVRSDVEGGSTLSLLVAPHSVDVLWALGEGYSLSVPELCVRTGADPSVARRRLSQLRKVDSVRRKGSGFGTRYSLTSAGAELLGLTASVESWLAGHPGGPHALGSERAQELVDVLIRGKASGVLDALADGPKTDEEIVDWIGAERPAPGTG